MSWVDDNVMQAGTQYQYDDLGRISQTNIELWAQGNPLTYYRYGYDRYGNRVSQSITQDSNGSGPTTSYAINTGNNQISGIQYDAAGNMMSDGLTHTYVYDAEGNVIQVDNNIHYYYNAFNQRVRTENGSSSTEYVYNILGQRVSVWDGSTRSEISGQYYWGSSPVAFYQGGAIHFQHQDWLGTERVRTDSTGAVEGTYQSLPFGDGFSASGTDNDAYHFAALDRDADDTHHAQFRQYSSTQGRWLSPDPYDGSYDASDPQSFNRYTYVRNNPLGMVDPSGLDYCTVSSGTAYQSPSDCAQAGGTWIYEPLPNNTGMCLAHCDGGPAPPDDPIKSYDPYSPLPPYIPLDPFSGYDDGSALDYSGSGGSPNNGNPTTPQPCLAQRVGNAIPGAQFTGVGNPVGGHQQFNFAVNTADLAADGFALFKALGIFSNGYRNGSFFLQVHVNGQNGAQLNGRGSGVINVQGHFDVFNPAAGYGSGLILHGIWDLGIGNLLFHHSARLDPGC
ncbi:MAG: hypothetical protein JSS95_07575 [Acidobacteria bacterium]|nr:hypothetical protein [Acidobacteriota bacterium]